MLRAALAAALAALAAGCGDDSPRDEAQLGRPSPAAKVTLVAALGDSITAGTPLWDPDAGVRKRIGVALDPESQYEYWAQLRLRQTRFRNCGVPGERSDQIARRLRRCARGAAVLLVQGGVNDIAQRRHLDVAAENLQAMVSEGKRLGLRVALTELLPWNAGPPGAAREIRELNRLIAAIGRAEGVPVLPWYRRLEDPRRPGRMKREWTTDGAHPSVAGYRRLGEVVELP